MVDPNGMLEENEAGELVLTKLGEGMKEIWNDSLVEAVGDKIDARHDELVETIDAYMESEVLPMMEDSVAELRKLMLLAVASIGGPDKAREFVKRVGELARAGSLSSATGAWAQGGPPDASSNRNSIRGGGISTRKEEVEAAERDEARAVFEEVVSDMDEDGVALMEYLCGDIEYSGDQNKLKRDLQLIRNQHVPDALTESYVRAIARTIRK
jgi:hypothetical protein